MKEKRDCKIVQDLLPNYIEKLTKEETNQYIEEHLLECNNCKKILENMQKDFKTNDKEKEHKKVKYIKKYNKRLKIFEISTFVLLLITISIFVYYTFLFRNAYIKSVGILTNMVTEEMYPDTFYATIEEIKDSELYNVKTIKVKGLNINAINYRNEFYFDVILDNIGDNFKIQFNGENIGFEQLKVGQTVAIYRYNSDNTSGEESRYLNGVRKIEVIDEKL